MNIQNRQNINAFSGASRIAKIMSNFDEFGEAANIAFDFGGKAVVVPAVIMAASKEPKEKKAYSAIKHPVAATIQLILEVPILYFGVKGIQKLANDGKLDKKDSDFSYNEKFAKESFINLFKEKMPEQKEIVEQIEKKGLTKKLGREVEEIISNSDDALKTSLKNFQNTHQRLYHLQNRLCFAAALLLTPLLCALENWSHPKIMSLIQKGKKALHIKAPSMDSFIRGVKR